MATVGANLAHGAGHGPVGALVSAWPALALVGSFELLMMLIRVGRGSRTGEAQTASGYQQKLVIVTAESGQNIRFWTNTAYANGDATHSPPMSDHS